MSIKANIRKTLLSGFAIGFALLVGCTNIPPATDAQASNSLKASQEIVATTEEGNYIKAKITKVIDGDTMEIEFFGERDQAGKGKTETIRLLLIDTPETKHPTKPVQPLGPEASQFAKDTLANKEVKIELDVSERDKYGRLLVYLWIGDKMFNEMLLEKGLARVAYVYPPNVKYVDQFREIQTAAQKAGVGIWSIDGYVNSDGFQDEVAEPSSNASPTKEEPNKQTASAGCSDPKIKGNINSKGDKIYHVPSGQYYDQTKPEEMFCTEEEAVSAGYRASKR